MSRNPSSSSTSQRRVPFKSSSDFQYASFDATRPPGGSHSPMALQGRSVRELEEQMSTLRKENFNLKLRIYFMEEGQPGARSNHIGEPTSKQLIDAKIEVEVLRKTLEEKTELLREAARAISEHEDIQRKADLESQTMIDRLQEQIRGYEAAARAVHPSAAIDAEKLIRLEHEVQRLENELQEADVRHKAVKGQMEFALAERLDTVMSCEAKIEELAIKNAELVERLQKDSESSDAAHKTIVHLRAELGGCQDENRRMTSAFNAAESELKRKNLSTKEASDALDIQREAIQLLESNIKHKDANYSRLMERVLDYEALAVRQTAELDSLRQETHYYRDLSESLQKKQRHERVAIVPPMRTLATSRDGYSSSSSTDRSGSSTSLSSNFSSLTVLCGTGGPVRESLSQWSLAQSSPTAAVPEADAPTTSFAIANFSREPATDPPVHEYPQQSVAAISWRTCDPAHCCCAQHRLLQIIAAKFVWVRAAPFALWHFALKLTFLSVRLHTCLLSTGIPMYVDRQGATSGSVRIVLTSLLCPNCRGTCTARLDERKPLNAIE